MLSFFHSWHLSCILLQTHHKASDNRINLSSIERAGDVVERVHGLARRQINQLKV